MEYTLSLARRASLAIALMIGFYLIVFSVVSVLLWIAYVQWTYVSRGPGIAFLALSLAFTILAAAFPRGDRFIARGPRLEEQSHRQLFATIREVAAAVHQDMPADVYLVNEVNAWVTHRGGIMGIGSDRVLGIGLPLLQGLTVRELRAVLAHEFGHYAAHDVRLGPWIYKTRAAIARAVDKVEAPWLSGLFKWYARVFLRLTHAVSRQQELQADAIAARVVGAETAASALRRVNGLNAAFRAFWKTEMVPALSAGCLPPITAGFHGYLASEGVATAVERLVNAIEGQSDPDPLDTHPTLAERLAALGPANISAAPPVEDPLATTLLADVEADARAVLEFVFGAYACSQLRTVEWGELASVYAGQWRRMAREWAPFLRDYTADTLPSGFEAFKKAGSRLMAGDAELRVDRARLAFSVGVATALLDTGAGVEIQPGQRPVFCRNGEKMDVFGAVSRLAAGTLAPDEWRAQCHAMGIAGRALHPVVAESAATSGR